MFAVLIYKLSNTGIVQWNKYLGGSNVDYGISIVQTLDGGYVISGMTFTNRNNALTYKLNNVGDVLWRKTFGGPYDNIAYSIAQTISGVNVFSGVINNNAWVYTFKDTAS